MKIRLNDTATPFELLDANGVLHRSTDYSGSWLLLIFHRHLG